MPRLGRRTHHVCAEIAAGGNLHPGGFVAVVLLLQCEHILPEALGIGLADVTG
jgi:hypothetical protein